MFNINMSRKQRENIWGIIFSMPWIIGFSVFLLYPLILSVWLSFREWNLLSDPNYIGLENFYTMLSDPKFWQALKVTMTYLAISLPLSIIVSLSLALLLNKKLRGMNFFRTAFFTPSVTSGVAVSILFLWILNKDHGILNYLLSLVGIQGPAWLHRPFYAILSIFFVRVWRAGTMLVVYLASLQNIPKSYYEAAEIDGASNWQMLLKITIPLITPIILLQMIMSTISGFQVFAEPMIMTDGGPINATLFIVLYIYRTGFNRLNMGYASAMAWILFVIIFILTIIHLYISRKWVYYEYK